MSILKVTELREGEKQYHFETQELVQQCPVCKVVRNKKNCCKCHSLTVQVVKVHTGALDKDFRMYSCDCVFSSFHRFGRQWRMKRPPVKCKHVLAVTKMILHLKEKKMGEEQNIQRDIKGIANWKR